MRTIASRVLAWLHPRVRINDRGQSTAEYLMWMAVAAGLIGLVIAPRIESILGGVLDTIDAALPG
jgi:hypothetical protein